MKFGVREVADVMLKAKVDNQVVGNKKFAKGQPVCHFDTLKTTTVEGAATTVYATGGKGNARLLSWEGERTLTFTVEDALLSPIGFAILSGAGVFDIDALQKTAMVHVTKVTTLDSTLKPTLDDTPSSNAPIFVMGYEHGSITGMLTLNNGIVDGGKAGDQVFVDYYVEKTTAVTELDIDASNFGGYYYVEASTLFKRESDGKDLPAELIFPKVKVQSNFTFNMASTGDPSTFSFVMDAMPAYTMFDKSKKVLCAMQIIDESASEEKAEDPVLTREEGEKFAEAEADSGDLSPNA